MEIDSLSGPEGNQNGALVELGYFFDQNDDFIKTSDFIRADTWKWVPLTSRTYEIPVPATVLTMECSPLPPLLPKTVNKLSTTTPNPVNFPNI